MKYKITLNNRVYEVEVEAGKAMLLDEYEAVAPAVAAPAVYTPDVDWLEDTIAEIRTKEV